MFSSLTLWNVGLRLDCTGSIVCLTGLSKGDQNVSVTISHWVVWWRLECHGSIVCLTWWVWGIPESNITVCLIGWSKGDWNVMVALVSLFPDKIFSPDISLTLSKIPDVALIAVKIPYISRFSIQVVTLVLVVRGRPECHCLTGWSKWDWNVMQHSSHWVVHIRLECHDITVSCHLH